MRDLVGEAYTSIWVSGEVQRLRPSRRGHHYFELIEKGGGDEVLAKLEAVAWRRDFERIRHSLAADGQETTTAPAAPSPSPPSGSTVLADVEREHIERVLSEMAGNVTRAAIALGIDRRTLQRKLKAYGMDS